MDVAKLVQMLLGGVSIWACPEPLWTLCSWIWGRSQAPRTTLLPTRPQGLSLAKAAAPRFAFIWLLFSKTFTPRNPELCPVMNMLLIKRRSAALHLNMIGSHYTPNIWVYKQCTDCTGIAKNIFQVMPCLGSFHSFSSPPLDQKCIKL